MSYTSPVPIASGTTFAQFQAGGASGHLEKLITAQVATLAPTAAATISLTGAGQSIVNPTVAATVVATGGGQALANPTVQATVAVSAATTGSLAAGTYYVGYTWYTPNGETTQGTAHASVSNLFTVTAGLIPIVTLPNLPAGATGTNIYLSNTNGANTATVLYRTGVTQATGATVSLDENNWNGGTFAAGISPPVSNTTAGACVAAATGNYFGYTWVDAHGETTLGTSVSTLTTIAAGNVPRVTIPALPTGAVSANIYMSNTNGANTALVLVKTGVTGTTADITAATWNGTTFAAGTVQPANNTTVAMLAPGAYLLNFTETNGVGETTISAESAAFTVLSQANPTVQVTGVGSSSGSTLPPGAYYCAYTWRDELGNETTAGTANATESAVINTTGTQILTITFNDTLPGWASGRNVYLTAAGGATGTETLYDTNIATATYVAQNAKWATNTTTQAAARPLAVVNTTSKDIPQVTFPTLQTGNTGRNLYLTAPGGATGTEVLYATGITTLTYDMVKAAPAGSYAQTPPAGISTGLSTFKLQLLRSAKDGNLQDVYRLLRTVIANFNEGDPMTWQLAIAKLRDAHTVFAVLSTLCAEAGALIDANPGTLGTAATPIGGRKAVRAWP